MDVTGDELIRIAIVERGREVRQESVRIALRCAELSERVGAERRRSLLSTTAAVDCEVEGHTTMLARLDRLSVALGRSPEIEQAKAIIAARYGIPRGHAFEILRRMSSRSNRKLRDVAADVVRGSAVETGPPADATLKPSG